MQKKPTEKILPIILLAVLTLFHLWFIVCQYWLVDSDMAQEMLLAKHLNDTGRIISKEWMYTTELRVYNINLFFRLGLLLFPDHWMYVRVFGSACVYVLLLFSIYLLFDAIGQKELWCYAGILLMIPIGTMYWFLGLFGLCYIFYAANILIVLACTLKRSVFRTMAAIILSFLLGLNGVKLFLLFYAPLAAVNAILLLRNQNHEPPQQAFFGLVCSAANLIGVIANYTLFTEYHYYRYADVMFTGNQWDPGLTITAFTDKLLDFLSLFGYQGGAELASFAGVTTILCGITVLIIAAEWKKTSNADPVGGGERALKYILLSMLGIDCIAFALLQANYNASYWIPAFVLAICLIVIRFKHNKRILTLTTAVFLLSGGATLMRNVETPIRGRKGLSEAAGWLVENGYKRGYAQFWDADACAEFSSGRLELWALNDISDPESVAWGQLYSHYFETPDRPFVIVRKGEWVDPEQYTDYSVKYETEEYVIYG